MFARDIRFEAIVSNDTRRDEMFERWIFAETHRIYPAHCISHGALKVNADWKLGVEGRGGGRAIGPHSWPSIPRVSADLVNS